MSIIRIVRLLLARARLLVLGPLLAMAMAVLLTEQQAPTWTATALIQLSVVDRTSGPALPGEHNRFDRYAVQTAINNLLSLLDSRSVAADAGQVLLEAQIAALAEARPLALPDGRTHPNPLRETIIGYDSEAAEEILAALATGQPDAGPADAFVDWARHNKRSPFGDRAIGSALSVKRKGDGDIVTLRFSAEDPATASLALTAIIDTFEDAYATSRSQTFSTSRLFFEEQVAAARTRLDNKEQSLKAFTEDNGISNYIDQTRALAQHIEMIGMYIEQAAQAEAASRAEMEATAALLGGDAVALAAAEAASNDAELLALEEEASQQQAQQWLSAALNSTEGGLQARTPTTRDAQITQHFAQRQTGLGTRRSELVASWAGHRVSHQGARAGREALEKYQADMREENNRYARLGSEFSRLERDIDVAEREYLELLDSLNTARLYERQQGSGSQLSILDPVRVPREAEPAGRTMVVLLSGIVSGALLVSVILLLAYVDRSLQELEDFAHATGLEILGGVPTLSAPDARPTPADLDEQTIVGRLLARASAEVEQRLPAGASSVAIVGLRPGSGKSTALRLLAARCPDHELHDTIDLSVHTDALRVASEADAVVVVLPTGMMWRAADRRSLEALQRCGTPVVGVLVNHLSYPSAEALLGAVPKPRGPLRRLVHQLLELRLRSAPRWIPADEPPAA